MNKIDVHNHLGLSLDGGHGQVDELLAIMDKCGIEKSVIFATDEEDTGETYSKPNERIIHYQHQHPDRFISFVRIIPIAGQAAKDEIKKGLDGGVRGLKLKCIDGFTPADCLEFIDTIKDIEHFPVLVHSEKGRNSSPKDWEVAIKKFPMVDFILAHGGKSAYLDCAQVAMRYSNVYVDTSTLSFHRTRTIFNEIGADKFLFASDYPYSHQEVELQKYELILKNDEDKEKIYEKNARKVLGL